MPFCSTANNYGTMDVKLSDDDRAIYEGPLQMNECFAAMQQSKSGKSPGMDGFPLDFYWTFWTVLEEDFVLVANEILQFGRLSGSQQKGVIRLLYKRADRRDLANWRPIS